MLEKNSKYGENQIPNLHIKKNIKIGITSFKQQDNERDYTKQQTKKDGVAKRYLQKQQQ